MRRFSGRESGDDSMMDMPRGLIVSCQALEGNPFRNSEALSLMAEAAEKGGAQAIRANGPADISAIRQKVSVPIIGLNKKKNECGRVVITPTFQSAEEVIRAGADIIAVDMTFEKDRLRENPQEIIRKIHAEYGVPVLADISTYQEALYAAQSGADGVSTTLAGYMPGNPYRERERYVPDFALLEQLLVSPELTIPVIAEGRFWRYKDVQRAFYMGVHAIVIGKAITNPMAITAFFSRAASCGGTPGRADKGEVH